MNQLFSPKLGGDNFSCYALKLLFFTYLHDKLGRTPVYFTGRLIFTQTEVETDFSILCVAKNRRIRRLYQEVRERFQNVNTKRKLIMQCVWPIG